MDKPIERAIEMAGGLTALAKAINVEPNTLHHWRSRGVPAERCPDVEAVTGGKVTCEQLRPDVRWDVLRNGCCRED